MVSDWSTGLLRIGDAAGALEDRPLALFLADHGMHPAEALERVRRDLELRPDIDSWDVLAWALHANGRHQEADKAMRLALRLWTRSARYLYQSGMIRLALGDAKSARHLLSEALAINPHFDPLQAMRAREALRQLISHHGC